jgi:CPA2 family monovalent cation:H+ antiporter-2
MYARLAPAPDNVLPPEKKTVPALRPTKLTNHTVLVGHGRVGKLVGRALLERHDPFVVIEDSDDAAAPLKDDGVEVLAGNGVRPEVLSAANAREARLLIIAIPNCFEAGQIVQQVRVLNPELEIVARAHSDDEVEYLAKLGANVVIMGEREIARGMIEYALRHGAGPARPAAASPPEIPAVLSG